ncbi:MAG: four helix bundle protein [Cyclobacteriaceae bacterium]|nr:four helix bundle protein [Cyclobacteriaceae bacterium]MDX5465883.1 four helix bundle protein [Cyclobacteriaceae bacterium]
MKDSNPILEKTFLFAEKSIDLYLDLRAKGHFRLADQFVGASTSIGANVEEAQAAHSKTDFISKMVIAAKEARETRYWLRLLNREELSSKHQFYEFLKTEIEGLIKILNSIIKTSRNS